MHEFRRVPVLRGAARLSAQWHMPEEEFFRAVAEYEVTNEATFWGSSDEPTPDGLPNSTDGLLREDPTEYGREVAFWTAHGTVGDIAVHMFGRPGEKGSGVYVESARPESGA